MAPDFIIPLIYGITDTNVYGTGFVKIWKTPWIYGHFYIVALLCATYKLSAHATINASQGRTREVLSIGLGV